MYGHRGETGVWSVSFEHINKEQTPTLEHY